ncbi:hypothetical protein RB614_39895 [Phytohabitans sp. ZYX-F-186]|uniref:Thioredoxin domain-containing protein n=1 Tax=Phytohabitans maris TaxID=3071409 RepID=A0ABU0ZUL5_9ACTN|nr:hypothetical protein [Phytohabitans sp. ZYX-F-186]MDQ7910677.1 hypothetical protein [Phytohabitans sp. ZYX-F-186]
MGNGNGGTPPEGGGRPEGVPDLPPEWGTVVIPDDLSELAEESAAIRKDLRRRARQDTWRRRLGWPVRGGTGQSSLRIPLLIMAVAVLATLASLFAVTWPGRQQPLPPPVARQSGSAPMPSRTMPALDLIDVDGSPVSLRGLLPAAVMLTDGCDCTRLVADTAAAAKPGVTVVMVTKSSAPPPRASTPRGPGTGAASVRMLADPTGELRGSLQLGTQGTGQVATVLLVARTGEIISTVPAAQTIEQFRGDLARLS